MTDIAELVKLMRAPHPEWYALEAADAIEAQAKEAQYWIELVRVLRLDVARLESEAATRRQEHLAREVTMAELRADVARLEWNLKMAKESLLDGSDAALCREVRAQGRREGLEEALQACDPTDDAITHRNRIRTMLAKQPKPLTGPELAAKHGFKPHGRDPLTGDVLPKPGDPTRSVQGTWSNLACKMCPAHEMALELRMVAGPCPGCGKPPKPAECTCPQHAGDPMWPNADYKCPVHAPPAAKPRCATCGDTGMRGFGTPGVGSCPNCTPVRKSCATCGFDGAWPTIQGPCCGGSMVPPAAKPGT